MTAVPQRRLPRAPIVLVAALFALAFLYELFGAVADLVEVLAAAAAIHGQLTSFAWIVLVLGLVLPVLAYALALLILRGRTVLGAAAVMLLAFCASEALTLSVLALYQSAA